MISLREARQEAIEIVGSEKVPAYSTLGDWVNKGFISGKVEGKFRKAKYPEFIVAEIITAIKLKDDYKLVDIAEFREAAGLNDGIKKINEFKDKLSNYAGRLEKKQSYTNSYNIDDDPEKNIEKLKKELEKIREIGAKIKILKSYNEVFDKTVNNLSDKTCKKYESMIR